MGVQTEVSKGFTCSQYCGGMASTMAANAASVHNVSLIDLLHGTTAN